MKLLARFTLTLLFAQMLIASLHEVLVIGVASTLGSLDVQGLTALAEQFPIDVDGVHAQLVLTTLTAIRPRGIAIAGPPGEWLHNVLPSFFLNPSHVVPGVWISAVLSRGSSILSLFITRAVIEMFLIVLGALIVRAGLGPLARAHFLRHPKLTLSWSTALGLFLQAQGVWGLVKLTPSVVELEYMGVGLLARQLLQDNSGSYQQSMHQILAPAIPVLLIVVALCLLPILERLLRVGPGAHAALISRERPFVSTIENEPKFRLAGRGDLLIGFALMFALTVLWPRSSLARTNVRFTQAKGPTPIRVAFQVGATNTPLAPAATRVASAPTTPTPAPTLSSTRAPSTETVATQTPSSSMPRPTPSPTAPSIVIQRSPSERVVQVQWSPARSQFVLTNHEGELFTIRGVNYNTHYTRLPQEEHQKILQRDFARMRQAGVNVISGYATFDETTLRVAQEYGLVVIMPFVLDLNGDYLDETYRDHTKKEFAAFVRRFESYPSLLMWNFDDEPLHNMSERLQRPRDQVQAFSDLLLELAEYAYLTDRYHRPSWLKEPREWYLDIFEESVKRARLRVAHEAALGRELPDLNRYIIAARSAYGVPLDIEEWQPRLSQKLEKELNLPFAIGEYGVVGLDPQERPDSLLRIWQESVRTSAIGSAVYTYGPFQPDPNDLTPPTVADQLKLVDENGTPVDDSWKKLSEAWLAQQAEERDNRHRSSIPLAVPGFWNAVQQWGGYPSSGPVEDDTQIKQFFIEGKLDNRPIAYALSWDRVTGQSVFERVESVIFNELGDYVLSGDLLAAYMENGGYLKFGAPVSNLYELKGDGTPFSVQRFAKGLALVREKVPGQTSP